MMNWNKEYFIGSPMYVSECGKYTIKHSKSTLKYELYTKGTKEPKEFSTLAQAKKSVKQ